MKSWNPDHPKAKLMARKRAQILAAAREAFLRSGYEGVSMESIASLAGVSIMTLYRHARSKDELFAAVVSGACNPESAETQTRIEALLKKPLPDMLHFVGAEFQRVIMHPDTVALIRAVASEAGRLPWLAEAAYRGIVEQWNDNLAYILLHMEGLGHLDESTAHRLSHEFLDGLFGTDLLRCLLGVGNPSVELQSKRLGWSCEQLLKELSFFLSDSDRAADLSP